jgi:hypothetical protein
MIHIYGDSHAKMSFTNLKLPYNDLHLSNVTMFRIGRDNMIINFNKNMIKTGDILVMVYGEIDCRCHIQRQIDLGKNEDDLINELVNKYFNTIKNNTSDLHVKIIIVGVIPPVKREEYEMLHGPITHEYPFMGTNENRVRFTNKVNKLLEEFANISNYIYFNPYSYYTRPDGSLKFELSDTCSHLRDNYVFLEKFVELYLQLKYSIY